jgi:hypothetical protein
MDHCGEYGLLARDQPHPDPAQETFFFGLLKELVEQGRVSETMRREQMQRKHVRHDALEVLARTPKRRAPDVSNVKRRPVNFAAGRNWPPVQALSCSRQRCGRNTGMITVGLQQTPTQRCSRDAAEPSISPG